MKKLEGKVAVITGGSSGIGLATGQRFVEEGAYVFITGRRQSEVDVAVNQIGKNVTGVQGDVSNFRLIHTGCTLNVSRDLRSLISYDQEGGTFILQHPISIHTSSIHSK